jgi:hypothetical protein
VKAFLLGLIVAVMITLTPSPAQGAYMVGCVIFPHKPTDSFSAVYGLAEQTCLPGLYTKQRVRVRLQEKKVRWFWPDEWHTKKISVWSNWTTLPNKARGTIIDCDKNTRHQWRTWVDGEFITDRGQLRIGADYSEPRSLACHVALDQTL